MKIICSILVAASLCSLFIFSGKESNPTIEKLVIPAVFADKTDSALHFINGICYYHQQLFSGIIKDTYQNDRIHHQVSYYNGKEEGWTLMYYPDGLLAEKRYYHLGEKDSVHTGWWQNGKLRFEYHFSNGVYNGDYKEWYNSGQPYKHIYYSNGTDSHGKGWRENGKLYMNYTMQDGRRYGIINSNLCYTIKNEKGDFVSSELKKDTLINNDSKPR